MFETRSEGSLRLLLVRGEVDLQVSPELANHISAGLIGIEKFIVHLGDVTYIDSSGIAVLIQGLKLARKRGVEFILRDPSPRVMAVMELARLDRVFSIEHSGASDGGC